MRAKTVLAALSLAGIWAAPAWSQGLLPASIGAWTAAAPETHVAGPQIGQIAGDKAAILQEYGIGSADRRDYSQASQAVTVTLYRMTDPTAAYGAFTFLRDPQMTPLAVTTAPFAVGSRDRAVLVVGDLVIEIFPSGAAAGAASGASAPSSPSPSPLRPADQDLQVLAAGLLSHAYRRAYPDIAGYLPPKGLEAGSEHYVLGPQALAQAYPIGGVSPADWVGFDKSAEAIVARYRLDGLDKNQEATLIVALYPTQQIASEKYDKLGRWFALNAADSPQTPGPATGRPSVFATRSSAMIAVLAGVSSRPVAVDFLDHIHYASTVTWNEPSFTLTDPGIGPMVVGAFMGTGVIMVLAIAAGIGFGGFRLLVKVLLPGKVFDSADRVEILQLGLTSKPIRASDFYKLNS